MLVMSDDLFPFESHQFVSGVWSGWEWVLHILILLACLAVTRWAVLALFRWAIEGGGWVSVVVGVVSGGLLMASLGVFFWQFWEFVGHLPASSFGGKVGEVLVALLVAAVLHAWAVLGLVIQAFDAFEEGMDLPNGVKGGALAVAVVPLIALAVWTLIATVPVVGGLTVLGVAVLAVIGVFVLSDSGRS